MKKSLLYMWLLVICSPQVFAQKAYEEFIDKAYAHATEERYDSAVFYMEQALPLLKQDTDASPEVLIEAYHKLGEFYYLLKEYEKAIEVLEEGLQACHQHLGEYTIDCAVLSENTGYLYCNLLLYESALPPLLHSLDSYARLYGKSNYEYLSTSLYTIQGALKSGNFDLAKTLVQEADSLLQGITMESWNSEPEVLYKLQINQQIAQAILYEAEGQYERAQEIYPKLASRVYNLYQSPYEYALSIKTDYTLARDRTGRYIASPAVAPANLVSWHLMAALIQQDFPANPPVALGEVYLNLSEWYASEDINNATQAALYEEKAVVVFRANPPSHSYAYFLARKGSNYRKQGNYELALKYTQQALKVSEASMPLDRPNPKEIQKAEMKVLETGIPLMGKNARYFLRKKENFSSYEGFYYKTHLDILMELYHTGIEAGNNDIALHSIKEATRFTAKYYGKQHPKYADCLYEQSVLLYFLLNQQKKKAIRLAKQALKVYERAYNLSPEAPRFVSDNDYLNVLRQLAIYMHNEERQQAMIEYRKRILDFYEQHQEQSGWNNNIAIPESYLELAKVYLENGELPAAKEYALNVIEYLNKHPLKGEDTPTPDYYYVTPYLLLGNIHTQEQDYEASFRCYQKAITLLDSLNTPESKYVEVLLKAGENFLAWGKLDEAGRCYASAYQIIEEEIGTGSYDYANYCYHMGLWHQAKGEYRKSEEFLQKAKKLTKQLNVKDIHELQRKIEEAMGTNRRLSSASQN
ncbi:tetratricopeptide repeat protein [Thermonema rossianum]|uniref:tetratricopeptide repeat protein n=1 Tax=Thermonema rossianum TaxID=55505 RepID=UPI000570E19B|nr:tetratricopeptide repeat protein [Thermonema rossianum]